MKDQEDGDSEKKMAVVAEGEKRMGREWSVWRTKTLEEQSNKIYGERDSCGPQKGEWTENY